MHDMSVARIILILVILALRDVDMVYFSLLIRDVARSTQL